MPYAREIPTGAAEADVPVGAYQVLRAIEVISDAETLQSFPLRVHEDVVAPSGARKVAHGEQPPVFIGQPHDGGGVPSFDGPTEQELKGRGGQLLLQER